MNNLEELNILKSFLYSLYVATDITLDHDRVIELLRVNSSIQRQHTVGNGEIDNEKAYEKALNFYNENNFKEKIFDRN